MAELGLPELRVLFPDISVKAGAAIITRLFRAKLDGQSTGKCRGKPYILAKNSSKSAGEIMQKCRSGPVVVQFEIQFFWMQYYT